MFDNLSGVITSVCDPVCAPVNALLLSGFVRFATDPVQPTGPDAEAPPSPMPPLPVAVEVLHLSVEPERRMLRGAAAT